MADGEYIIKVFSQKERKQWTEEELRKAKPLPIKKYLTEEDLQYKNEELAKTIEKASSPDAPPGYDGWQEKVPEGFKFNPELTHSSKVNNPQLYPFNCIGKLTFEDNDGNVWCGSAAVVHPNGILTAAHCVFDTEKNCYFKNIVFSLGHTETSNLGLFEVIDVAFPAKYKNSTAGFVEFDFAFCRMKSDNKNGKPVGANGYLTALINQDFSGKIWTAIGYPLAKGMGHEMWKDMGKFLLYPGAMYVTKENEHKDFDHGGMSGGPWLLPVKSGDRTIHKINGVTSKGKKGPLDVESSSPYFDKSVSELYETFFTPK